MVVQRRRILLGKLNWANRGSNLVEQNAGNHFSFVPKSRLSKRAIDLAGLRTVFPHRKVNVTITTEPVKHKTSTHFLTCCFKPTGFAGSLLRLEQ